MLANYKYRTKLKRISLLWASKDWFYNKPASDKRNQVKQNACPIHKIPKIGAVMILWYPMCDKLVIDKYITDKEENDEIILILMRKKTDLVDFIERQTPNGNMQDNFSDWNP
jgi:hypothetical protein